MKYKLILAFLTILIFSSSAFAFDTLLVKQFDIKTLTDIDYNYSFLYQNEKLSSAGKALIKTNTASIKQDLENQLGKEANQIKIEFINLENEKLLEIKITGKIKPEMIVKNEKSYILLTSLASNIDGWQNKAIQEIILPEKSEIIQDSNARKEITGKRNSLIWEIENGQKSILIEFKSAEQLKQEQQIVQIVKDKESPFSFQNIWWVIIVLVILAVFIIYLKRRRGRPRQEILSPTNPIQQI